MRRHLLMMGVLAFATPVAYGMAPLTLQEAQAIAVQAQPAVEAYSHAAEAARQAAVAEAQLPDPRLNIGMQNLLASGADAFRPNADDMTMMTFGVTQDMVRPEKRQAAARRAQAEAAQWLAERDAAALAVARDVGLAWIDAFEAERQVATQTRMIEEMRAERETAMSRLSSGVGAAAEILPLDNMIAMAVHRHLVLKKNEALARAMLARWLGDEAQRPLAGGMPEFAFVSREAATAELAGHPVLRASRGAEEVARAELLRARAERRADWSWELMYGRRTGDDADLLNVQLGVALPWNRPQRQDRGVAQKAAELERARALSEDRRRFLTAERRAAWAEFNSAEARLRQHGDALISAARARLGVAQAAYGARSAPLKDVWEARRGVLDLELEHWALFAERARAALRLQYLGEGGP